MAGMNRRTPSYEILREASMGPTQRQSLADHPDNDARAFAPGSPELRKQAASSEAEHRSLFRLLLLCAALFAAACVVVVALTDTTLAQLPQLLRDVASFRRTPCTAMDNAAAVIAIVMAMPPLVLIDYTVCAACCPNPGARWFLLHALGNFVVAVLCVPDFVHTARNPPAAMSVSYCASLPSYGQGLLAPCSDWPTCIIIAMHLYHMLSFQLDANDMFHHLLFVPIIGGMNFVYPNGAVANILSFFISGLPGGVSYLLLAMVKTGHVAAFSEKRISCSINTWIRGPGICAFCTICILGWSRPHPGTPPTHVMPWFFFWPSLGVVFFNGQYYAQRVIGNYYIRKAQDHAKRGIKKVDLHTS